MPKGVEHSFAKMSALTAALVVRRPLMPKGVEHIRPLHGIPGDSLCEETSDAERR